MKRNLNIIFAALAAAILASSGIAYAEDKKTQPASESHEEHHPEGQTKEKAKDSGMMGSMKMDDMMGMMHECMNMHKDGKMCDQEVMQKCQDKMGKGDCQKMMKQAKAKEKSKTKK